MKPFKIFLVILIASFFYTPGLNAQILKKLKSKVQQVTEDAITNKAAEKVGQETEKAMDSLLDIDPDYESKSQEHLQKLLLQNNNANIPVEDVYKFDMHVIYKMNVITDNKLTSMDYNLWFSNDKNYLGTKIENIENEEIKNSSEAMEMFTILDDKNQAIIMLLESQKLAQVISMEKIKNLAAEHVDPDSLKSTIPKLKKTGRSKKILGYTCEEFSGKIEDGDFSFWITQDLDLFQKNMFLNMNNSLGGNPFNSIPEAAKGFMMETNFENTSEGKNRGDTTSMIVTKITKETLEINTKQYQKMNLGSFMKN